jgi:hypothetical protein
MRSADILQAALQNTGGTIVTSVGAVAVVPSYEVVYPPPGPGPPLSETIIIVIAVGGVLGLVALIGVARYCNADMLRETTRLVLGIARTATGQGVPKVEDDKTENTKKTINVVVKTENGGRPSSKKKETAVVDPPETGLGSRSVDRLMNLFANDDDDDDTKRSARNGARVPNDS